MGRSQVLLVPAYLLLLWAASSVARGKGLVLFGLGVVALGWALRKASRGDRQPLFRLFLGVLLSAFTVLGMEAALTLFPGLLSGRLANYVFSGYHGDRDGIYRHHRHLGVAMKPDQERRMYWNGHWWRHRTNADGFRGPWLYRADAVFLGDSMVYGHGVEEDEAVPAQFQAATGLATANLGQQGTGLLQALGLFREKGARLRPQVVFVSVHPTDALDNQKAYPPEELEAFQGRPGEAPVARPELRAPRAANLFDLWAQRVALPLRVGRVVSGLRGKPDWALTARAPSRLERAKAGPYVPGPEMLDEPYPPLHPDAPPELRLGWAANRAALAQIQREAAAAGGRVVVFDLGYPRSFTSAVEALAGELGAAYSPAGRVVMALAQAGEPMYLANDGHWTPEGSRLVAQELARAVPPSR